jgi:drug/metabolite transporter (DMT)-like permease
VLASALVFGEVFSPVRYLGMALILAGLVVIVFPERWLSRQSSRCAKANVQC